MKKKNEMERIMKLLDKISDDIERMLQKRKEATA